MKKTILILFIAIWQPLLSAPSTEVYSELLTVINASGLVHEKNEIVSNVGTWQIYEANCIMQSRNSITGDRTETKFLVYFIKDKNSGFSDFCVFKSKAEISQIINYFKDRWSYLADGIDKGLINFMEAGITDKSTLGFYFDNGGGWRVEGKNGNLILDKMKSAFLRRYIEEISSSQPTESVDGVRPFSLQ